MTIGHITYLRKNRVCRIEKKKTFPNIGTAQNLIIYICVYFPRYRMLYKPMFKVAYKTITELEWRCCPGFTGVGCNMVPTAYGIKAMPPFKGHVPSYKGPMPSRKGLKPSSKGPQSSYKGPVSPFKGPMPPIKGRMPPFNNPVNAYEERMPFHKGPMPHFQGPISQPNYYRNHYNQPLSPSNIIDEYPGPNAAPSYPENSFESHQEPETGHPDTELEEHNPLTNNQDSVNDPIPDHEPITNYQDSTPDLRQSIPQPETKPFPVTHASSGDSELNQGEIKGFFLTLPHACLYTTYALF